MTDYTTEPTYQYFDELIETKTPIIPKLSYVRVKKNGTVLKELNIIYYNPEEKVLRKIYDTGFATFILGNLLSFELGMSSRVLAGIVRSSKPDLVERWRGDTIEKTNHESFSLYRGLLSIIGKNDGLPFVAPQNIGVVGDIIPGIKQVLNGKNPTIVRQKIKQLESMQYRIAEIISDNSFKTVPDIADTHKFTLNKNFQGLNDKQIARLEKLGNL